MHINDPFVKWVECLPWPWASHTKDLRKWSVSRVKWRNPGKGVTPPLYLSVVAIEREPSGHPGLRSLTLLLYTHTHTHIHIYRSSQNTPSLLLCSMSLDYICIYIYNGSCDSLSFSLLWMGCKETNKFSLGKSTKRALFLNERRNTLYQ